MSAPDAPVPDPAQGGDVRELRLAVVLYGGASLAIYMHGTTKELQRLVKASALADRRRRRDDGERAGVRRAAGGARRSRPCAASARESSSTSSPGPRPAGSTASISRRRWRTTARRTRCATSGSSGATSRCCCAGPAGCRRCLKVPLLLAGAVKKPVLKGDAIARWMYEALRDMDQAGSQPAELETLMPPSHPLELFVTVTDFHGYRRDVAIADPKQIGERAHRHVLSFRLGDGVDQFDEAHNGALAFSARTTMSFPGAFPPISLTSFQAAVAKDAGDVSAVLPELFRIYELAHADPRATFFIDGGVLDNKPFGYAIAAIKRRAAESEVKRRLLYLEPDPGGGGGAAPGGPAPSPIATVLASISGLPREEPVLDDILEVNRHNERVLRIQEIVETSFDPIRERIEEIVGTELAAAHPASSRRPTVVQWRTRINEDAKAAAGFAYPTYLRSKVSGVVDSFARTICRLSDFPDDSNQAHVRARGRPLLGGHAPATRRGRPAGSARRPGRVPADVRPRLPRAPAALRDRRPQRVVRARRRARLPDPRAARRRQAPALGGAGAARRRDGRPEAAHEPDRRRARGLRAGADRRVRSTTGRGPAEYAAAHADELARLEGGVRQGARREARRHRRGALRDAVRAQRGLGGRSGAPSCSSATSASRTGTSCSTRSSRSPTPASGTRSRSSA